MGTRYRFFDKVWDDNTKSYIKGMPNIDLYDYFRFDDDIYPYEIPLEYQYRPALLAYNFYGDAKLFWVLVYANRFSKCPEDFATNVKIRVPRKERILDIV
jgi:hypothetical protein